MSISFLVYGLSCCMVSSQYVSLQGCFFWELHLQPDCVGLLAGHQEGEVNVPSAEYLNLKSQFIGLMTFFFHSRCSTLPFFCGHYYIFCFFQCLQYSLHTLHLHRSNYSCNVLSSTFLTFLLYLLYLLLLCQTITAAILQLCCRSFCPQFCSVVYRVSHSVFQALQHGFFNFETFDVDEYEHYEV